MINQAKLRSYRHSPKYMFGFEIPRNYKHALELDKKNGNTRWQDATKLESDQLHEYDTFESRGEISKITEGYKRIRNHLVFAIKYDSRQKARIVADGYLTDVPLESVYSGVVSLGKLRIVILLEDLNGLDTYSTDIGNVQIETETK